MRKNKMKIFEKEYSDESLVDIEEDVYDAVINSKLVPEPDEDGFRRGTFKVTIEWEDEE